MKKKTETVEKKTRTKEEAQIDVLIRKINLLTELMEALCTLVDERTRPKGISSEDLP